MIDRISRISEQAFELVKGVLRRIPLFLFFRIFGDISTVDQPHRLPRVQDIHHNHKGEFLFAKPSDGREYKSA
jgi:hypothetical protein